jgi:putative ABC transport system permease protein
LFPRLLFASWLARRGRLALALTAVTLGVGVTIALATLAIQVGDDLARSLRAAGPNFVVLPAGGSLARAESAVPAPRAGLALPESSVARIKTSFWRNNVLEAAPELTIEAALAGERAPLTGTWFDAAVRTADGPWRTGLVRLHPQWSVAGRWPGEDEAAIALGQDLAARLHLASGAELEVASGGRRARVRVCGLVSAGGLDDRRAWAPLPLVQSLAGREGEIDRVWMSALVIPQPRRPAPDIKTDPAGYERWMCTAYPGVVAHDIADQIPDSEVLPMTEIVAGEGRVVERLNLLMLLLALAALSASVLGLLSTTTATVVERSTELGLLRALGAAAPQIAALLLGETLLIALPGGALGWVLGSAGAALIRGGTFGSHGTAHPLLLPLALALSVVIALLGTLGPLRLALRMDAATVLRG